MQRFQCLLLVLKQSYICYYIICVTVPLIMYQVNIKFSLLKTFSHVARIRFTGFEHLRLIKRSCFSNYRKIIVHFTPCRSIETNPLTLSSKYISTVLRIVSGKKSLFCGNFCVSPFKNKR